MIESVKELSAGSDVLLHVITLQLGSPRPGRRLGPGPARNTIVLSYCRYDNPQNNDRGARLSNEGSLGLDGIQLISI